MAHTKFVRRTRRITSFVDLEVKCEGHKDVITALWWYTNITKDTSLGQNTKKNYNLALEILLFSSQFDHEIKAQGHIEFITASWWYIVF